MLSGEGQHDRLLLQGQLHIGWQRFAARVERQQLARSRSDVASTRSCAVGWVASGRSRPTPAPERNVATVGSVGEADRGRRRVAPVGSILSN